MKNKSTKHKDANTFKFQPFSERISNIDIDIFHKISHEYEIQQEETECHFYQTIIKWNTLNLTNIYDQFKKEIKANEYITLPQLLLAKDRVVEIIFKYLKMKDPLCLQPLLEITVAIARDLQKEFYPYYTEILTILIDLLNTKDTEQLEWTFTCLAYLFKFLWRPLVKNINTVFNTLLPLLSDTKPEYINAFAAESFAFVARKVKDREAFLNLLIKAVEKQHNGVLGCGKLLFEVIHGVNNQFHSCAEVFLPFFFDSLINYTDSQTTLFDIIEQIMTNIAMNIKPDKNNLIWTTFFQKLSHLGEQLKASSEDGVKNNMKLILNLFGQMIEYKSGALVQNPTAIIQQLIQLFNIPNLDETLHLILLQISISVLLSKRIKLPQEQVSQIIRKILSLNNKNLLIYFVDHVNDCSSFEMLILPYFLKSCASTHLDQEHFYMLTKLTLKKSPFIFRGINFVKNWNQYSLDFREYNGEIFEKLFGYVDVPDVENKDYFCALACLSHIKHPQGKSDLLREKLLSNLNLLVNQLNDSKLTSKLLFFINILLSTIINIDGITSLKTYFHKIMSSLLNYSANIKFLSALSALDLLITVYQSDPDIISMETLLQINAVCQNNFNSPYHEIRLLTTHIYSQFDCLDEFQLPYSKDANSHSETFKVFTLCYEIESIEPLVQTYRDQLQKLEKLTCGKPQMLMCIQTDFKLIPLRYLCGVLYMNFQLLWEPVSDIIASHAHVLDRNEFWSVFGIELNQVVKNIKAKEAYNENQFHSELDCLNEMFKQCHQISMVPDFINYRSLLWNAMRKFSDVAEAKTRDVSELLLNFVENEFNRKHDMKIKCNIKEFTKENEVLDEQENNDERDENNEENTKKDPNEGTIGKKVLIKLLINKLSVFAQFKNPKVAYRESELYQLYFDLLKHSNSTIQQVALNCIACYKFKHLSPYKQHLDNLIDNKNFKNEIVTFPIDKESTKIIVEHRDELMPLILQIVFSKMTTKIGLRTGGKSSGQNRRGLILRFLAGCEGSELLNYVQKVFGIFSNFIKENDDMRMVENIVQNLDLKDCFAPKKLLSVSNLLTTILDQFGGLMDDKLLTFVLKIIFIVGAVIKGIYDNIESVHAGYFQTLRIVKSSINNQLARFFKQFPTYSWSTIQIETLFNIFIWPFLDRVSTENIHSPTSLLKLIHQWALNARYFKLLVKHKNGDTSQHILAQIFKLLPHEKVHVSVIAIIFEMIENMLKDKTAKDEIIDIETNNILPVAQDVLDQIQMNKKLNYGSCLLLPYIPVILEKFRKKLIGINKSLNERELFILSRISELVWEADISDQILHLLLPIVLKKCTSDESIVQPMFMTVNNLIGNVHDPQIHLRNLTPCFGRVSYTSCRKILLQIIEKIAEKEASDEMNRLAHIIRELNAFDARWIDQPDFERRHETFKVIQNAIKNDEINLQLGVLLIYNCYYFMKVEKDLSLRDNSSHILKCLCPYLLRKYQKHPKNLEYILNQSLFPLIKRSLRANDNMNLRNECISLLGHLARECPDSHVILKDLNQYTNKLDLEVDFFENIIHIQTHRQARAMTKFCQIIEQATSAPSSKTITHFLLPLASFYLCSDKFLGKNSLIDASLDMMGTLSHLMPWYNYEILLKNTLLRLRTKVNYQKQLVRLTVAILDAFHFDLTKGESYVDETVVQTANNELENNEDVEESKDEDEEKEQNENNDEDENEFEVTQDPEETLLEETAVENKKQKILEKITRLSKSAATRAVTTIQTVLLPQLHKALAQLTHYDTSHKINRKVTAIEKEEEDLIRVPISLAVVKLLQRLPKKILDLNLPGVFLKLCTFLKSRLESVRRVARETFQKIMVSLGPKYLKLLLDAVTAFLNRGFQVHVLVYTVHAVLSCLKEYYEPGDIDEVLLTVINLCTADLFGILSEEKEIVKIASKTSEAKSTKSNNTLQILAQYITEKCLIDLVMPINQYLEDQHTYKTTQKIQEALRFIALGLLDNKFISTESLLKFAYGSAAERIVKFQSKKKKVLTETDKEKQRREKTDCFLIPKIPDTRKAFREMNVKVSSDVNSYLLVEFGLRLCYLMLKRERLKDEEFRPYLDPFVEIFNKCLVSKHVKLSTVTLQCLQWTMKHELPSMKVHIKSITKVMFSILHKYAASGLSKGDNFELVVAAFKAMAVLLRDIHYFTVNINQLKILLLYVEQDMHDNERQATAFGVLKAIISRKLIAPEIHDVMLKVAELSITSELDHVRSQARMVFHHFLMEYPLGKRINDHLGFYLSQMSFELRDGRESAIEMIKTFINSFPVDVLNEHAPTMFITLGARLINDDVPECRKMIADCLTSILEKLSKPQRDPLFDILTTWFKDRELIHRQLAAQLCGIFVLVEKSAFDSRLPVIKPLILKQFGLTDTSSKPKKEKKVQDEYQRVKDHHKFQVLQLILKISIHCPVFLKDLKTIQKLAAYVQTLLGYPYDWVRLAAVQFLGCVLSSMDAKRLGTLLNEGDADEDGGYLCDNPGTNIKKLALDLCDQLQPEGIKPELAEQVIKNLVFITRVLQHVPALDKSKKVYLLWLTKRMRRIVYSEIIENPSSTVLRTEVFKWIAGIATILDREHITAILSHLMSPLVREMITTEEKNAPLRHLAKAVGKHLKEKVGVELYLKMLQTVEQNLTVKKLEKKRTRAQLAVTDPERFAQKKIKRQEKKKIGKKRKMEIMKGKKNYKRRKTVDLETNNDNDDIM